MVVVCVNTLKIVPPPIPPPTPLLYFSLLSRTKTTVVWPWKPSGKGHSRRARGRVVVAAGSEKGTDRRRRPQKRRRQQRLPKVSAALLIVSYVGLHTTVYIRGYRYWLVVERVKKQRCCTASSAWSKTGGKNMESSRYFHDPPYSCAPP